MASIWPSAARRTKWPATLPPGPSSAAASWSTRAATGGWTPSVPLVVPEVNPDALRDHHGHHRQPELLDHADGRGAQAAARRGPRAPRGRQHLSGHQRHGRFRLARTDREHPRPSGRRRAFSHETFAHPIAFNVIPQIGSHKHQGYTSEEMKMVYETRKIMGDESIQVCPTCVRVPVANCHSESILVETERKFTVDEARELFAATPGIVVVDDLAAKQYPMPHGCNGRDEVFIGRIREDLSSPTAWRSGASATTCAREPRPTPCRSPNCWPRHARLASGRRRRGQQRSGAGRRAVCGAHGSNRMRTIKLTLAYDGTAYAGWQVQTGQPTLQERSGAGAFVRSPANNPRRRPAAAPTPASCPGAGRQLRHRHAAVGRSAATSAERRAAARHGRDLGRRMRRRAFMPAAMRCANGTAILARRRPWPTCFAGLRLARLTGAGRRRHAPAPRRWSARTTFAASKRAARRGPARSARYLPSTSPRDRQRSGPDSHRSRSRRLSLQHGPRDRRHAGRRWDAALKTRAGRREVLAAGDRRAAGRTAPPKVCFCCGSSMPTSGKLSPESQGRARRVAPLIRAPLVRAKILMSPMPTNSPSHAAANQVIGIR